ncbi:MAG: hypothetical protein DWQ10_18265 [Calditrichaeota bacterium]|nr:MAG: hypothetical protein DWQ10_18265 [Calditrichota bacterium]
MSKKRKKKLKSNVFGIKGILRNAVELADNGEYWQALELLKPLKGDHPQDKMLHELLFVISTALNLELYMLEAAQNLVHIEPWNGLTHEYLMAAQFYCDMPGCCYKTYQLIQNRWPSHELDPDLVNEIEKITIPAIKNEIPEHFTNFDEAVATLAAIEEADIAHDVAQFANLLPTMRKLIDRFPKYILAYAMEIKCLYNLGFIEDSKNTAGKAVEQFPDNLLLKALFMRSLLAVEDRYANNLAKEIESIQPRGMNEWVDKLEGLFLYGNVDILLAQIPEIEKVDFYADENTSLELLNLIGCVYRLNQDKAKAEKHWEEAKASDPNNPLIIANLNLLNDPDGPICAISTKHWLPATMSADIDDFVTLVNDNIVNPPIGFVKKLIKKFNYFPSIAFAMGFSGDMVGKILHDIVFEIELDSLPVEDTPQK